MTQILISTARTLLLVGAALVVILGATLGGGFAEANGQASLAGTIWGGFLGFLLASICFGTLAAIFDIQRQTRETVALLREMNARNHASTKAPTRLPPERPELLR